MRWLLCSLALIAPHTQAAALLKGQYADLHLEPESTVGLDVYVVGCKADHLPLIEEVMEWLTIQMAFLDPSRRWVNHGYRYEPGNLEDGVRTLTCRNPDNVDRDGHPEISPRVHGSGLPHEDGEHFTDGQANLNIKTPDWEVKRVVLHEFGHAIFGLQHSTVPGSTMQTVPYSTARSSQLTEQFSQDDWCAVQMRYRAGGESLAQWPVQRSMIDDMLNLYVPYAEWQGAYYEFTMVNTGEGSYGIVLAKEIGECG